MDTKEIRKTIQAEIDKTEKRIEEYREMSRPVAPDAAIGRVSRMDAINNKSITESALRQAEAKLKNLNHVLGQVGSEAFGRCLKCKQPIPLGRILARPESLHCVNCAD
jgi:DnaK suppressor protein